MDKPPGIDSHITRMNMNDLRLNNKINEIEDQRTSGQRNSRSSMDNLDESEKPSTKMAMLQTPDLFKATRIRSHNTPDIHSTLMTPRDHMDDKKMNLDSIMKKPDENKPPAPSGLKNGKINPNLIRSNLKKLID